jgi:5-methylcytosine-specific restriction endonuclease McrA
VSRALVLNASFEPLCVVATRRALLLVLDDKAELVNATDRLFRSERVCFHEPSVVRLRYYVKVPFEARVALNRRAVFVRDGHRCQYCDSPAENIDHVIPRSRGGAHSWENVVAACRPCNARKMDHFLHETSMNLRRIPRVPRERIWLIASIGAMRPDWEPYLQLSSLSA